MARIRLVIIAAFMAALGGTFFWFCPDTKPIASETADIVSGRKSHRATAEMITSAGRSAGQTAFPFKAKASNGETYSLGEFNAKWPVVLIFIKNGCPCSKSAERYFQQLHAAGGGRVPFFGVIDGDETVARRWADVNGTPFPVLADPDLTIIRAYGAESSAYVALISPGGRLERLWAGYSVGMLRELTGEMKRLSGWDVKPIEAIADAPDDLYSGCPFDL